LIHEYGEGRKVYHVDLYRIDSAREAASLGLSEIVDGPDIVLVEWGERFPELWPPAHIEIHLNRIDDESREISVREASQANPGPHENVSRYPTR
ncbi:MAG: tRNA (adenosine(37)-N6)-threonylcarbamoyltransferase complex ATPase subunit type 1 TsaE, partial [Armatimonadia bacterium]